MKMKPEHFKTLEATIKDFISNVGKENVKEFRQEVSFVRDQFISFIWAILAKSTDHSFRRELYTYLNDSHVETALRQILAEYKEVS